jgi:Lon protease-like protein
MVGTALAVPPLHLPLFPLPDVVFFPHTLLPLHVFEPRYRAMVTDALARDKRLAVVGLKPGWEDAYEGRPPVFEVAGAGRIVQWERLPTGRYNLLLRGECRVRIEREVPADTLYRIARVTALVESGGKGQGVGALAEGVKERCLRLVEAVGRPIAEMREALGTARTPGALCDQVASTVVPARRLREALLEELDVERRLRRVTTILDGLLERLARGRDR